MHMMWNDADATLNDKTSPKTKFTMTITFTGLLTTDVCVSGVDGWISASEIV